MNKNNAHASITVWLGRWKHAASCSQLVNRSFLDLNTANVSAKRIELLNKRRVPAVNVVHIVHRRDPIRHQTGQHQASASTNVRGPHMR